eukprot:m.127896 g.127896  ORF g.127896 m.127896 type:complete len:89 (-) comp13859_c0_seq1:17-283(-)
MNRPAECQVEHPSWIVCSALTAELISQIQPNRKEEESRTGKKGGRSTLRQKQYLTLSQGRGAKVMCCDKHKHKHTTHNRISFTHTILL